MRVRVASAGTGKTTSLVLRYLELIAGGTPLRRLAGVTFTRTAADELRQRVEAGVRALLDEGSFLDGAFTLQPACRPAFEEALRELDGVTLGTIHGFMIAALRLAAPAMALDPDFRVWSEWEAEAAFEEELASLLYLARDPQHGLHRPCRLLGDPARSLALELFAQRSLAERFTADDHPRARALQLVFDAAYDRFAQRLGAGRLPPAEVERRALRLVRTPAALRRVVERFPRVLVDEFQDVNPLQGRFFEELEAGGALVEVVGDPKQSIYGFRNADVGVFRRALANGTVLEPLTRSYRHASVVARFLNGLTNCLAERGMGFGPEEAPVVEPAGAQAGVRGRVELHWVAGDAPVGELRAREAEALAARLRALHCERGHPYGEMAVLARSYAGLRLMETALGRAGVPSVMLQGRGYYERTEVRDLVHALRVGVEPAGLSLAAWLRSPFAQLALDEVDAVLAAHDPLGVLALRHPRVMERLELIRGAVRGTPLAALKFLIREPFLDGSRYVDFLERRARENVDALLFTVAAQPPGDLEVLLERLDTLSRQADAGDVPQSGEGVQLLTVHRAKGLEWPVTAVFDLGRMIYTPSQEVLVDPDGDRLCCRDSPAFAAARARLEARDEEESYRLLYVALSRAREVLLMSGSVKGGKLAGWARALGAMGLGPDARAFDRPEFLLRRHRWTPPTAGGAAGGPHEGAVEKAGANAADPAPLDPAPLDPAPWTDRRFPRHPHPPVQSPSRLKAVDATAGASRPPAAAASEDGTPDPVPFGSGAFEDDAERLPIGDPDEGERLPGRATTVGTLVHYAISQNWSASDARHLENLRAQEVMFPFSVAEQADILAEVGELLASYERMLGRELPALAARDEDHPELPMALPLGATVWQGVIDRLYRVDGVWWLEDYKTDREVAPERYHLQLAVYLAAVERVRGVTPRARLVYLRSGRVVEVPGEALREAFRRQAGGPDAVSGSGSASGGGSGADPAAARAGAD